MNIVGSSRPVHDAVGKATGKIQYAGDVRLPGMAHLALVYSSVPHGRVKSVDASAALAMEGVYGVYHCFNTTENTFCRYHTQYGQETPDQERVFNHHVRFIGDRVAAVAAVDRETARRAAALVRVEYEELPYSISIEETLSGKINDIHEDGAVYGDYIFEHGNKPEPTADSVEVTTEDELSRLSHIAMEPHACVAEYGVDGVLTVYSPNQAVFGIRTVLAELFGLPYNKVRVVKATMGGSFGAKQEWMLEPVAAAVALQLGRPVSLVFTRGEAMVSTICRAAMRATAKSRFTKDGVLQSMELDVTNEAGAYLGNSSDYIRVMAGKAFRCYRQPYLHYTGRAVCTNTPVSGAYRGWGAPETACIIEHNFNQAARRLGIDPIELRLRNVALAGDMDEKMNLTFGELHTKECLELGREKFQWEKKKVEDAAFNRENPRFKRGVGVGCGGHGNTYTPRFNDFGAAELRMTEDGTVLGNITLHDHGCGTITAFQMIVAEELGVAVEQVELCEGDSSRTPFDYGCFSSRTTYVVGRAAQECARKLRELLLDCVATVHKAPRAELYTEDAVIKCRSMPELAVPYALAARESYVHLQKEAFASYQYSNVTNPGVTGSHFAHVEVDTYTGMVRVLDYLAVHDIGKAINRGMCVAQIQGAVLMGCGGALTEDLHVAENGRCASSLMHYHLVNAPSAPEVQVELVEEGNTEGPFGAKSIGEVCHVPVAAAVCGAVNEALGSDIRHMPMNPDYIMAYLSKEAK